MRRALHSLAIFAVLLLAACQSPRPPLRVVETVDLARYQGTWYEIASYPQRFQRGCVATQATYTLEADETIRVVNQCRDGALDGELRGIEGVAWVADPEESLAKLRVRFFWPFSGAYWIIDLDADYRYAVVGHPNRDYLWILSRTRRMDEALYSELVRRAEAQGFEGARLVRTLQPGA